MKQSAHAGLHTTDSHTAFHSVDHATQSCYSRLDEEFFYPKDLPVIIHDMHAFAFSPTKCWLRERPCMRTCCLGVGCDPLQCPHKDNLFDRKPGGGPVEVRFIPDGGRNKYVEKYRAKLAGWKVSNLQTVLVLLHPRTHFATAFRIFQSF
jgi:hypothetical protein